MKKNVCIVCTKIKYFFSELFRLKTWNQRRKWMSMNSLRCIWLHSHTNPFHPYTITNSILFHNLSSAGTHSIGWGKLLDYSREMNETEKTTTTASLLRPLLELPAWRSLTHSNVIQQHPTLSFGRHFKNDNNKINIKIRFFCVLCKYRQHCLHITRRKRGFWM